MHLTRRYFLKTTGALAVYLGVAPFDLLADEEGGTGRPDPVRKGRTLVVIFLRGGADGLNLVVPFGDPDYYKLRSSIAIPAPGKEGGAVDLDGHFALHPRLASLGPLFEKGLAVAAHAVGYDKNTRSHFEEQDVWETGVIGNTVNSDGWLNRHLITSEGHGPVRAVSIGTSLPRILRGQAPAYAIRGISDLAFPGTRTDEARVLAALEHAYRTNPEAHRGDASDLLAQTGSSTLEGVKQLQKIAAQPYQPKAQYPNTDLGRRLSEVARLIKADIGLEVAEVDYGGWDTHQNQGGTQGQFANLVGTLGDALAAFAADLDDRMDDVVVTTVSDFGRTAAENGTQGTDHGWANSMLLLGGPVKEAQKAAERPSKVIAKWPGLAPDKLNQGRDLLHTTDFRNVLAELVRVHLGNAKLEKVLPGHQFEGVGLIA